MKGRARLRHLGHLVAAALLATATGALAAPAHADAGTLGYTFADGTDGFTAPTWLSANGGDPVQSTQQVAPGSSASLALPVNFTGGGFDQAGADRVIDNFNPVDLSLYRAVQFAVYAPVPNISADLVFNDPWDPPGRLRALAGSAQQAAVLHEPDGAGAVPAVRDAPGRPRQHGDRRALQG